MKKVKIFFIIAFALSASGCLKDNPNVDFSNISAIAEISSGSLSSSNSPISGLDYFAAATLPYIGDKTTYDVTFDVNITGEYPPKSDITVTLGVDDAKRVAYNSKYPGNNFVLPADSNYTFAVKSAVIKAGSRLAQFKVTFKPQTLDPAKSYMLPISITDASGITISGNLGTVYLHIIGNPIAGVYKWDYTRWNAGDGSGTPNAASFTAHSTIFVPDDATTVEVQSGYGAQNSFNYRYVFSFTNTNGVLSNVSVKMNTTDVSAVAANNGITLTGGPTLISADPVAGVYKVSFQVFNGSANRYFEEKFYK